MSRWVQHSALLNLCIPLHFGRKANAYSIALNRIHSMASQRVDRWRKSCTSHQACVCGGISGDSLMNSFDITASAPIAGPKKKRTLLPLLTAVFIVSYALMTLLIVEQGAAIQSQSNLINVLLPESRELWGLKGKAITGKQSAKAQAQAGREAPSGRDTSRNAQTQAPASEGSQSRALSHADKAVKPPIHVPPIPASDLDPRRTVHTI